MFKLSHAQKLTPGILVLALSSIGMSTQAVLATSLGHSTQPQTQTVPCKPDNSNCPWKQIKDKQTLLPFNTQDSAALPQVALLEEGAAAKAGNPCKPSSTAAKCRNWVLGNPTPPVRPKK